MAQAEIKAVITAEDRASRTISGFGLSFTKMAGAVGAGIAIFETLKSVTMGVAGAIGDTIKAFADQEVVTKRLQAGINNVTSATDKNIDMLLKQASALQKVTRFSDDQIISAQGILTTFQLNQDAIQKLTPRLIDMAEGVARLGGEMPDLEGNAILVAKALGGEDVVGLAGALRRVGVIMTEHQQQILQTGNMQERLAIITAILDQNFRGLGEAAGTTASAKFLQLQFAINDLQEQLGAALYTALSPFIQTLTDWARSDQAKQTIDKIAKAIVDFGKQAFKFLQENWPQIKEALINLGNLAWNIVQAINAIAHAISRIPKPPDWLMKIVNPLATYNSLFGRALFGRATGGSVVAGQPYTVGEQGPEMFVPTQSGRIIPNSQMNGGSTTINIAPSIGIYAGTPMERRKLAEQLLNDMKDVANGKGIDLMGLIAR